MSTKEEPNEFTLKEWQNDPKNWKLGFLYYNKKDARLFPPKRFKGGWTVNFANPNSIIAMSVVVIIIFFVVKACKG